MTGKPNGCAISRASSTVRAMPERRTSTPAFCIASLKRRRSSPSSTECAEAPRSSTPYRARTPALSRATARFRAVWPPTVGRRASGRSFAMTRSTVATSSGSM